MTTPLHPARAPRPRPQKQQAEQQVLGALQGAKGRGKEGLAPEQLEALNTAVELLEADGGEAAPTTLPQLDGKWRLLYTSRPGSASPIQRTFTGVEAFSIFQVRGARHGCTGRMSVRRTGPRDASPSRKVAVVARKQQCPGPLAPTRSLGWVQAPHLDAYFVLARSNLKLLRVTRKHAFPLQEVDLTGAEARVNNVVEFGQLGFLKVGAGVTTHC